MNHKQKMEAALRRIEKWFGEFPPTGRYYDDGLEMTYGGAYGSDGERDFMRNVARQALELDVPNRDALIENAPDELTILRRRRVKAQRAELRRLNKYLGPYWAGFRYGGQMSDMAHHRRVMAKVFGWEAVQKAEKEG